jgi:hypothetical protein
MLRGKLVTEDNRDRAQLRPSLSTRQRFVNARPRVHDQWHFQHRLICKFLAHTVGSFSTYSYDALLLISGFRSHVEISAHHEPLGWVTVSVEIVLQAAQPRQLVGKLLAANHLPVGHIDTDDSHPLDVGGQEADRRFVLAVVKLADDGAERRARENSHSIVGSLPGGGHVVACRL